MRTTCGALARMAEAMTSGADTTVPRRRAAEQDRPDVAAARLVWPAQQPALKPEQLVFIDETWATTNLARQHGRARRGQRGVAAVPHGHWKTTTFNACSATGTRSSSASSTPSTGRCRSAS
jgi:hypothetical protein